MFIGFTATFILIPKALIIPSYLMLASILYFISIRKMFTEYVGLISEGMTQKEKASRKEACQTYGYKDTAITDMPYKQKVKNVFRFVFKRR